jgi:hypothetical protein
MARYFKFDMRRCEFTVSTIVLLGFALAFPCGQLRAYQNRTTGAIAGTVRDPSGAMIPGATITVINTGTHATRISTSTAEGSYLVSDLEPGNYTVRVSHSGFNTAVLGPIAVTVGGIANFRVTMKVGEQVESVTVSETAPVIEITNPNTATTLTAQQLSNIPNPGMDLTYIANLAPGAVMNTTGGYGNTEFNGLPSEGNFFTEDGMPDNDPFLDLNNSGPSNLMLGQNAVQEVSINTNSFSAAQGGLGAAQMNYVTKVGTNQFHGNAYETWNGSNMNAADYFVNAVPGSVKPSSNVNQFGGSIGGPIKKNKAFFFFDYEGLYISLPEFATVTVPSAGYESYILNDALPNGGLDYVTPLANGSPTPLPAEPQEIPWYQKMFSIYGTPSGTPVPIIGCPLGAGAIANSGLSDGNGCGLTRGASSSNDTHERLFNAKVSQTLSKNDQLWYRFTDDRGVQATYTSPFEPSVFNADSIQPDDSAAIGWTHTFSPNVVNEINPGFQWYSAIFVNDNPSAALTTMPIQLAPSYLSGVGGADYDWPQGRNVTQYFLNDNLSWVHGRNQFTFGENFHRFLVSDHDFASGTTPYMSLSDLPEYTYGAVGYAYQYFPVSEDEPIATAGLDAYAQDQIRVTPKLTLSPGIRATWNSDIKNQQSLFSELDNNFYAISHNVSQPLDQAIQDGQSMAFRGSPLIFWQPRMALAYELRHNTVLRSGFGTFVDIFPAYLADYIGENPPYDPQFTGGLYGPDGGTAIFPNVPGSAFSALAAANQAFVTGYKSGVLSCAAPAATSNCIPAVSMTNPPNFMNYPYSIQWNFTVEHQFGSSWGLNISYVGTRYLQNTISESADAYETACAGCFSPYPYNAPVDSRFGSVTQIINGGSSIYNGLQTSVKKTTSHGVSFDANYTWSHCLDYLSNGGIFGFDSPALTGPIPGELYRDYGNCDYDIRNSLNADYVWKLPNLVHNGFAGAILNGWQVSGTLFAHSGYPFTPESYVAGGTFQNGSAGPMFANRVAGQPLYTSSSIPGVTQVGQVQFLNPDAYASVMDPNTGACVGGDTVANCTFGNGTRNSLFGPSLLWTDMDVSKFFKINERIQLRVDAQFYNLLNHPNFNTPGYTFGEPGEASTLVGVGTISSAVNPPTSLLGSGLGGDNSVRMIALKAELIF